MPTLGWPMLEGRNLLGDVMCRGGRTAPPGRPRSCRGLLGGDAQHDGGDGAADQRGAEVDLHQRQHPPADHGESEEMADQPDRGGGGQAAAGLADPGQFPGDGPGGDQTGDHENHRQADHQQTSRGDPAAVDPFDRWVEGCRGIGSSWVVVLPVVPGAVVAGALDRDLVLVQQVQDLFGCPWEGFAVVGSRPGSPRYRTTGGSGGGGTAAPTSCGAETGSSR